MQSNVVLIEQFCFDDFKLNRFTSEHTQRLVSEDKKL